MLLLAEEHGVEEEQEPEEGTAQVFIELFNHKVHFNSLNWFKNRKSVS